MTDFPNWCYIDSKKKRVIPIPEKEIVLLKFNKELWERLFDKLEIEKFKKLEVSNIGVYSITKLSVRKIIKNIIKNSYKFLKIKKKLKDLIITDSNGGNGGISIYFSKYVKKVNCIELNNIHYNIIKNNLELYNVSKKVKLINDDYVDQMFKLKQDVIICDPPWGGKSYKKSKKIKLQLDNIDIVCIINQLYEKKLFTLFILLVPYNYDMENFFRNIKATNININLSDKVKIITIMNSKVQIHQ